MATLSAGAGGIPLPVIGGAIDFVLIRGAVKAYCKQLGLNNKTSKELALLDTKYKEIIRRYEINTSEREFASTALTKASGIITGVEEIFKFIPIFGVFRASTAAFALTLRYLLSAISKLEEAVWDNAAKGSIQND